MMSRPIIIPRPDPLTLCVPVWLVFWGVIGPFIYDRQPPASIEGLPAVGVYAFFIGLVVSGSALLFGMWLRNGRGVQIKFGANIALGLLCFIYAGWAIQGLGFVRALVFVSWLVTIGVASFWNARRLNAVLRQLEG